MSLTNRLHWLRPKPPKLWSLAGIFFVIVILFSLFVMGLNDIPLTEKVFWIVVSLLMIYQVRTKYLLSLGLLLIVMVPVFEIFEASELSESTAITALYCLLAGVILMLYEVLRRQESPKRLKTYQPTSTPEVNKSTHRPKPEKSFKKTQKRKPQATVAQQSTKPKSPSNHQIKTPPVHEVKLPHDVRSGKPKPPRKLIQ